MKLWTELFLTGHCVVLSNGFPLTYCFEQTYVNHRQSTSRNLTYPGTLEHTHTSGHDYLDAEKASCLMKTHWNAVWSNRENHRALSFFSSTSCCGSSSFPSKIHVFQVWGFESQSRSFFRFVSFSQLCATVNQWRMFFEQLHRLINMSCHWSHITKIFLDWDSKPRPGNVEFDVELELPHSTL